MKWCALVALICLSGCSERWDGYAYPNRSNLSVSQAVGTFETLEDCRAAAQNVLHRLNATSSGDYECGLNCNGSVCERTSR